MPDKNNHPVDPLDLRRKAEALVQERSAGTCEDGTFLSAEEMRKIIHELRVQKTELEMRNEALGREREELAAQKARYFNLYDLAPVGYCTLSEQGLIIEANRTAATLLHTKHDELINKPISRFILKEDQDIYCQHREKLFETGKPQECELRMVKADNLLFWAHLAASAAQAEDGAPVGCVVISDITQRKQTETALTNYEQLMRYVIDHANSGVAIHDRDLNYLYVSQRYLDMYNVQEQDVLGKHHYEIFPDLPQKWREAHQKALRGEVSRADRDTFVREDGTVEYTRWECRPWYESDGSIGGIIVYTEVITDLLRQEQSLREYADKLANSEENLRITLNSIGDAVISTDADGRIVLFNPVAQELTGFSLQEALGRDIDAVFHIVKAQTNKPVENPVRRVLEEGKVVGLANHTVLISKDGSRYHIADSGAPIKNPAGEITGAVLVFRDVTETYRQQEALRESETRYRSLFHNNHSVMLLLNPKTAAIVDANPAACRYYGYDKETLLRMKITDINRQNEQQIFTEMERAREEQCNYFNFQHRLASGDIRDVEVFSGPISVQGEKFIYSIIHDITERKQLEQERDKLLAAFHQTKENIVITDTAGRIEYVNPAFETLTGYSAQEVIGENPRILQSGEHDQVFYRQLWDRLTSGYSWQGCFVNKKKDGTRYIEEASISPVIDPRGRTTHYVAVKRDISSQQEMEQQLRQKSRMEAVGLMAGGLAHNFNNNLSIILGNLELIQAEQLQNAGISKRLGAVHTAALRSRDLIKQIMLSSRQARPDKKPLRMERLITETYQLLRATIPTSVAIEQHIEARDISVLADATQIQECLINLCNNAIYAMDEKGTITITLKTEKLGRQEIPPLYDAAQPGVYAKLSVEDTGCGMSQKVIEKAFDMFFTTKAADEGTGLGLSTVQGIIRKHAGLIRVQSQEGRGTTFDLYLPLLDPKEPLAEEEKPCQDISGGRELILFVDDEPMLTEMGEQMLQTKGYNVSSMNDSREALKLFSANAESIDLLITDQTMPGLSGIELIQKVKEIKPGIPVILCTGYSRKVNEDNASECGIDAYLPKPLEPALLFRTVRRLLDEGVERSDV
jgi:PAS domain S-box-containing protein